MSTTASSARRDRGRGYAGLAVLAVLVAIGAGCGSGDEDTSGAPSVSAAVEKSLYEKGDTQEISCESIGPIEISGVSREVVRCGFTEEKDGAGEMRARGGCFTLENGNALDVTVDIPAEVDCFMKP